MRSANTPPELQELLVLEIARAQAKSLLDDAAELTHFISLAPNARRTAVDLATKMETHARQHFEKMTRDCDLLQVKIRALAEVRANRDPVRECECECECDD